MQSFRFLRIPLFPPNALFFLSPTPHLLPVKPVSRIPTKNFSSQMGSSPSSSSSKLLFRQLFEKESSTYTYLLADVSHPDKPALLIDPVDKTVDRDLNLIGELGLKLVYAMNTHVHADHITGTGLIKSKFPGAKSVISRASGSKADVLIEPGDRISFGDLFLELMLVMTYYMPPYLLHLPHSGRTLQDWRCLLISDL